jgi:hypothetical protein
MIAGKIQSVIGTLSGLGNQVSEDEWQVLSCAMSELRDAAALAEELENCLSLDFVNAFAAKQKEAANG